MLINGGFAINGAYPVQYLCKFQACARIQANTSGLTAERGHNKADQDTLQIYASEIYLLVFQFSFSSSRLKIPKKAACPLHSFIQSLISCCCLKMSTNKASLSLRLLCCCESLGCFQAQVFNARKSQRVSFGRHFGPKQIDKFYFFSRVVKAAQNSQIINIQHLISNLDLLV